MVSGWRLTARAQYSTNRACCGLRFSAERECRHRKGHSGPVVSSLRREWNARAVRVTAGVNNAYRDCPRRSRSSSIARTDRHLGFGEATIEAETAPDRPPVVQEDLKRPPVRYPAEDQRALLDEACDRLVGPHSDDNLRHADRNDEHQRADRQRPAADAKELVEVPPGDPSAIVEIAAECLSDILG